MNILIDELPRTVAVQGKEYRVNWGFRTFVLIEICIFDGTLSDEQRVINALQLFYGDDIPKDTRQAFDQMMWFYRCGKKERKLEGPAAAKAEKRCYCFEQDASYIYSAFLTQYGIDLQDIKSSDLHWWKFRALFDALGEELKMSKIIGYRVADTSTMTKAQAKYYREMKRLYALEVDAAPEAKMNLAKRDADMKAYVRKKVQGAR